MQPAGFHAVLALACFLGLAVQPPTLLAREGDQDEQESGDPLDDELSSLEEDDFPDLVGADEEGDLIDEFAFLEEAGTVESAARHKQDIGMSPSAITVITREDIETSGATSVPDLLRMVPGMDVVVSSPMWLSTTSRLYWSTEGLYYLVLVDGREANVELLGFTPWTVQPFSPEEIERIEIIRGPGSSLYGANAMAGVISITTRPIPENASGQVHVSGGEVGTLATTAHGSMRVGNWGFSLGGGFELAGSFDGPRSYAKRAGRTRALVEYRLDPKRRFVLDAGFARGKGPFSSSLGGIDTLFDTRTARLAFESPDLRGQLTWQQNVADSLIAAPLEFTGIRLARFIPFTVDGHTCDAEIQWELPSFWEPLFLILGGGGRLSLVRCDQCLDADTFGDITSASYHKPGMEHLEGRAGAFLHGELSLADWVTVTGGVRFDYNTETSTFISPRLATVFRPFEGQHIRLGAARAFRKPTFMEKGAHIGVAFPDDSPIQGPAQDIFQEFMTRVLANDSVTNEELYSFEIGYLGQFLDDRLTVTFDLYVNLLRNIIELESEIVPDDRGLPDLEQSFFRFDNVGRDLDIFGGELSVRWSPSRAYSLVAAWSHREIVIHESGEPYGENPKNLITLGGRFRTDGGILGSLYVFTRSEFWDRSVPNPAGLMEPVLFKHLDHVALVIARLGWSFPVGRHTVVEAGLKLFLPISPFSGPTFRYREEGGGSTPSGESFGGEMLGRVITGYLQGSF